VPADYDDKVIKWWRSGQREVQRTEGRDPRTQNPDETKANRAKASVKLHKLQPYTKVVHRKKSKNRFGIRIDITSEKS